MTDDTNQLKEHQTREHILWGAPVLQLSSSPPSKVTYLIAMERPAHNIYDLFY